MGLSNFGRMILASLAMSAASAAADTSLTIYSRAQPGAVPAELYRPSGDGSAYRAQSVPGYAIVRQDRELDLQRGRGSYDLTDVAALLDPTTVRFESLTDPDGTRVIEQDFRFDLVATSKLLERYLDQQITVRQGVGPDAVATTGTLLSTQGGLVLRDAGGGIDVLQDWSGIEFGALPGGLMTRPTLVWDIQASRGGRHDTRVSYETAGITWWADYNLVWNPGSNPNAGTLDVGAWVSIVNQTGATFEDAGLKLVAGDVQRAQAARPAYEEVRMLASRAMDAPAGFEEKAFFEFHLYTLGRETTIPNNATKQLELFPAVGKVPAAKRLVYDGANLGYYSPRSPNSNRDYGTQSNPKVDIYLEFDNSDRHGLGAPLPAGRIRVSQLDDADGSLEFIGEDVIDHTPRNESVRIRLGSAFDVIGERTQTSFNVDSRAHWIEESFEITVTNRKTEPVEVVVREHLFRWANWKVEQASDEFEKEDARTIVFPLTIAADGGKTVRYTVRYTW